MLHKNNVQKSYRKLSGSRDTKHGFRRQIGAERSKMGRIGTLETVRNTTTKNSETTGQGAREVQMNEGKGGLKECALFRKT